MPNTVLELMPVVPQTYGEAIVMYPWITCESHEWDNRTTVENAVWLIRHLTSAIHADGEKRCPDCGGEIGDPYTSCKYSCH